MFTRRNILWMIGSAAIGGLVLVLVLALATFLMTSRMINGASRMVVQAPDDTHVEVRIDDAAPFTVAAGARRSLPIGQGSHHVTIRPTLGTARTLPLEVHDGRGMWLVPAREDQCWVQLSVYFFYRDRNDPRPAERPSVAARYRGDRAQHLFPGYFYFDESELPQTASGTVGVYLMRPVACDGLAAPDDELVRRLGY